MGLGAVLFGEVGWTRPSRDVRVLCEGSAAALVGLMAVPRMPVPRMPAGDPRAARRPDAIDPIFSGTRAATLPELVGDDGSSQDAPARRLVSQNVQLAGFALSGFAWRSSRLTGAGRVPRPYDEGTTPRGRG
jgi:hypothetical protein